MKQKNRMDIQAIFVMILLGAVGLFSIGLGWRYRVGKTMKLYFLQDRAAFYALLGIPFGLFWLSLSVGMFIGIFLPETDFLTNLSGVFLAIGLGAPILGFVLSLFQKSFIYPGWIRWLEQSHKDILNVLREEVKAMGVHKWAEKVQTQEDLEKWIAEVRHNRESNTILLSHKQRQRGRAHVKKEIRENRHK